MYKDLFSKDRIKMRLDFVSNILKESNGKFLLGEKVSIFCVENFCAEYICNF